MDIERPLTKEEHELVAKNVALAKFLYGKYFERFQRSIDFSLDADELLSQAYQGLIRAAMRWRAYGEEHGYSEESIASGQHFGVFARKSIIGQMLDSLRKLDHVHTLVRKDYKALVESGLGSSGTSETDLSDATGLSLARVQRVIRSVHSRPVSLNDQPTSDDDEHQREDYVSSHESVESSALVVQVRDAFATKLDSLPALQQIIIVLKYYEGLELPAIADELGIKLATVRTAHTAALVSLHGAMQSSVTETS
jgi:RNA polymerase sigma factor (sigma-70 family)